ncbi:MAG: hypothetical protein DWI58_04140 [Chloroflexi bacterium]|nr:MAG: hypothetical protein DWI58_04140 [Chloroflexota bacterium]
MSSRLRDVLNVTVGMYLCVLGGLLLSAEAGWLDIGRRGLAEAGVGLFLIALGVLSILAETRARRVRRRLSQTFGHIRSAENWSVEDGVLRTVFGDIDLDLREANLPVGETALTLLVWVGAIRLRVPYGIGLEVEAQTFVGTVDVLGQREEGLVRDILVRTDRYAEQERRLHVRISTVIGELEVIQEQR